MTSGHKGSMSVDASTTGSKDPSSVDSEILEAPDTVAPEDASTTGDTGKLKMVLSILRQFIGVKDMATVRFSLPAQLMEPIPNLEYWHYLDRPDYFVCIGESEDPLERMLSLLRWYLTKDLKLINGKICKPYNSVLGEFFRCTWNVEKVPSFGLTSAMLEDGSQAAQERPALVTKQSRFRLNRNKSTATAVPQASSVPTTRSSSPTPSTKSQHSTIITDDLIALDKPLAVAFLCEQTSHHPPVSAYMYSCPEKNIEAYGMDQIAAKFTGTTVKVQSGEQNEGIFVRLTDRDEEYRCTHPTASVCGFLRGSLYASVQDTAVITCTKTGLRTIIAYKDEPWIGKAKCALEGAIFRYDSKSGTKMDNIKDIPESAIVARLEGSWKGKIYITSSGSSTKHLLIDVTDMPPLKKVVPNLEAQKENESRVVWQAVTSAIHAKKFEQATKKKTEIEDAQRQLAKKRAEAKEVFQPVYFNVKEDGRPTLTDAGKSAVAGQLSGKWSI